MKTKELDISAIKVKDMEIKKYLVNMADHQKEYGETFKIYCEKANYFNPFSRTIDPKYASINLLFSDKTTQQEQAQALKEAKLWQKKNANKKIDEFTDIHVIFKTGHKQLNYA